MSLKGISLSTSLVGTAALTALIGLGSAPASATELKFLYVDSAGDEASFYLPSSPTPSLTSTSPEYADFTGADYTGTGALASGTGIQLFHNFYFPLNQPEVSYYDFFVVDGNTRLPGGYNAAQVFWAGSVEAPTFAPTPTENIGGNNYITITDAVPEPAAWTLMLVGFGGLGVTLRSARRRAAAAIG